MKAMLVLIVAAAAMYTFGGYSKALAFWNAIERKTAVNEQADLIKARDELFEWKFRPAPDCAKTKSELRKLECRQAENAERRNWNADFAAKVATGWRPRTE